jgi:hypothetical protein
MLSWAAVGLLGYYAGPRVHIVDPPALGEPLLARLPAVIPWHPGHFERRSPEGYWESLEAGRNLIPDPKIHAYYDDLLLVTRGPVWSWERFRAIARLNLGADDALLADFGAVDAQANREPIGTWTMNSDAGAVLFERGLRLRLEPACRARRLELQASGPSAYRLRYSMAGRVVGRQVVSVSATPRQTVYARVLLPAGTSFDHVDVTIARGVQPVTLWRLRFYE